VARHGALLLVASPIPLGPMVCIELSLIGCRNPRSTGGFGLAFHVSTVSCDTTAQFIRPLSLALSLKYPNIYNA
jgi:hypothetical protein